jgi:N utilization substance protein B
VSDLGFQRHSARERALEVSYEAEMKERPVLEILNDLPVRPDEYCVTLLRAVSTSRNEAEAYIAQCAIDWPLERISVVDRLIMTLAISEMLMDDAPPRAVILDEAVELAKSFSGDEAPSFVNGVLASVSGLI